MVEGIQDLEKSLLRCLSAGRRYLWAGPATVFGLALAAFALRRGGVRVIDGTIEAHGPALRWALSRLVPIPGGAAALTLGHVILARDLPSLEWTRAHERAHVLQYERWGPFFLPAYAVASLWAMARGGHAYFDNHFERAARTAESARLATQRD
jgi:hypothetical protein